MDDIGDLPDAHDDNARDRSAAPNAEKVRLDKWLWATRFFKTRALATQAVDGGHVHVNGARVKGSRPLHIGDEIALRRGHESFHIIVRGLSKKRGPAALVQQLFEETEQSRRDRAAFAEQRRRERDSGAIPSQRPDKKQRRQIARFLGRSRERS
jgi:ribosome-associated heat shock protein Hsp15